MWSKRLIPVVALLLVAAVVAIGAAGQQPVLVPPGALVESPNARSFEGVPAPEVPDAPQLPAADAQSFVDAFSGTDLQGWTNAAGASGTWVAKDGRLQQRGDADGVISSEEAVLVNTATKLGDGTLQAQVYPMSGEPVGVVFKGSDAGYYKVRLYQRLPNSTSKARLEKVTSAGVEVIATAPVSQWGGYTASRWQTIEVATAGSRITVSVDGTEVFNVNDSTFANGWVGVSATADMGADFDNVRVLSSVGR